MSVIIPGSYDPVTLGHLDVIKAAAEREDEVYAVVFINESKQYSFSMEDRVRMLELATGGLDNVLVSYSTGRVVDYMREHGISRIIKGYRNEEDLKWERYQAEYNFAHGGYETELIECRAEHRELSSTLVRERLGAGLDISKLVPDGVAEYIDSIK
ncbi:MAG: pantetheine-phosphate adenylyltransferase [Clostridia bacterium]|nr:pantetheine-phosphate adenylyltransferase [Clostridia bacterium]